MPPAVLRIDKLVSAQEITVSELKFLRAMEPFGSSNEPPVFVYEHCRIEGIYAMGGGKHLRLKLNQNGQCFYAVYFHMPPENFHYQVGDLADIAANCDINNYQGKEQISVKIRDIRPVSYTHLQFGEGGAGTFSDGKLTTRIHDPRCGYVMEQLTCFGAPAQTMRRAKPVSYTHLFWCFGSGSLYCRWRRYNSRYSVGYYATEYLPKPGVRVGSSACIGAYFLCREK